MGHNNLVARPADHRIASSSVYENFFTDAETVSFTVAGTAAVTYELRNYYGTVIATGAVGSAGSTLSLGVLPLGWYKLYFIRSTPIAPPWFAAGGEVTFAVIRATSVLKARPTASTSPVSSDRLGNGFDLPARGICGVGPARHQIRLDATNYAADKAGALADIAYENTYRNNDTGRPFAQFLAFPNFDATVPAQVTNLTDAVQACVAAGVTWFESVNEPNSGSGDYTLYYASFNTFCDTVHAAHASAKTMGPCTIAVYGDWSSDGGGSARYAYKVLTNAGASRIDGFSFHNYNSGAGDLPTMRATLDNMVATLTAAGVTGKPRWNTEALSQFASANGVGIEALQAKNSLLELHLLEQYAVPKERTYIFYDRSHGFWGFPSWWLHSESTETMPAALAPLMRVWAEELWGKPYSGRLSFGSADDLFLGSQFTGSDGSSVVVLQSSGQVETIRVTVAGGATSLVTVDAWGNLTTRTVSGGVLSLPVSELPTYVRCPSGVTLTVSQEWGVEVVRGQLSTATASTGATTAARAIDGVTYNGTPGTSTNEWVSTSPVSTWQTNFPRTSRINRVSVLCAQPINDQCTLLDFDIQVLQSGVWNTIATFTEPTGQKMWASYKAAGACFVDSWWSVRNQWSYRPAAPVSCDGVRINARAASYGASPTPETVAQQTVQITGTPTGGTWRLTWNSIQTAALNWNATPAQVLSALQATSGGSTWTAVYGSTVANGIILVGKAIWPLTGTSVALTGGTSPAVSVSANGGETGGRLFLPGTPTAQLREVLVYLNEYDQGMGPGTPVLPQ